MAVRGGSGRFADSSSLTSVETMPSPKTEVRPYLKLSRRRSSLRDRENSIHLSHEPSKHSMTTANLNKSEEVRGLKFLKL